MSEGSDRCDHDGKSGCGTAECAKTDPRPNVPNTVRRRVLGVVGGATTASLAGCVGLFGEPEPIEGVEPDDDSDEADDVDDGDAELFDVEYVRHGETIEVAENEELLYAGLDEGWDLPYSCESGVCGVCTSKVDGNGHDLVEMDGNQVLDDDEIEEGYVLTCVGYPRDDFALDTEPDADDDADEADDEADEDAASFDVEFTEFGETLEIAENEELLYAGLDEGWDLDYQCEAGVCGVCKSKVDGNGHDLVEMTNNDVLDDDEIEEGYVLTCTGQPRDDFSIDTDI